MPNERPVADIPPMPDFSAFAGDAAPSTPEPAPITEAGAGSGKEADKPAADFSATNSSQPVPAGPESVQALIQKLSKILDELLDESGTIDVKTYTSEKVGETKAQADGFGEPAKLFSVTRIDLRGNTHVLVPAGKVDKGLWDAHADMVRQAQESRARLLENAVHAATALVGLTVSNE